MKNFIDKKNIKGDFFGGITAGIVALPLALAFGITSGLGAEAGLYGAIFTGIFAAIFGGTPSQITGPTAPMTVIVSGLVATTVIGEGGLETGLYLLLLTFILAGLFQIVMGIIGIGKYIKYIPYPVISGFMSGIGVIIIITQLMPMLGVPNHLSPGKPLEVIRNFHFVGEHFNFTALGVAGATIAIIYLLPKLTKVVPSALVALVVVSAGAYYFVDGVHVLGAIPSGLPVPRIDTLAHFDITKISSIIVPAITLAFLGAIDSLLTSVIADNVTKTKHNSNKELIGQGIGNAISGIFGGIPGAGATIRTVVNVDNGGKNRISGVIHGALLLVVLLGAGPIVSHIPQAVLAGILITVGISIIDYRGLKDIKFIPRSEAVIMVMVLGITVFYDLIAAVGAGVILATILFMKKMGDIVEAKSKVESLEDYAQNVTWKDEGGMPDVLRKKVYIKHIDGPLFFGFKAKFQELSESLPDVEYVVIRMERVPYIDQTGLYGLEESILFLEQKGVNVLVTGLQQQPRNMMTNLKIIPRLIPEEEVFDNFNTCVSWMKRLLTDSKGALE